MLGWCCAGVEVWGGTYEKGGGGRRNSREGGRERRKRKALPVMLALIKDLNTHSLLFNSIEKTVLPTAAGGDAVYLFPQDGHLQV
jgi:hypothetical protein